MKSILQDKKECWYCHSEHWLNLHHIFYGRNKKNSDRNGFVVYLCVAHHTGPCGVHSSKGDFLDKRLKIECQKKFEETHTRAEFMRIIGKNYIPEEEDEKETVTGAGDPAVHEGRAPDHTA